MAAKTKKTDTEKVLATQPVSVEIRINRKVRLSQTVYGPQLSMADGEVVFTASLEPTLVDAPPSPTVPQRFNDDPRNADDLIMQVHSGRRDL